MVVSAVLSSILMFSMVSILDHNTMNRNSASAVTLLAFASSERATCFCWHSNPGFVDLRSGSRVALS